MMMLCAGFTHCVVSSWSPRRHDSRIEMCCQHYDLHYSPCSDELLTHPPLCPAQDVNQRVISVISQLLAGSAGAPGQAGPGTGSSGPHLDDNRPFNLNAGSGFRGSPQARPSSNSLNTDPLEAILQARFAAGFGVGDRGGGGGQQHDAGSEAALLRAIEGRALSGLWR
eukprot:1962369-Rhodomonas_salina.2